MQLQGNVDFSRPKTIQGSFKLSSDSLDLTGYCDLFAGGANAGAKLPLATASQPQPASTASQEPPAVTLPLQNFTVAADIGRLYLRELTITNLQTT